MPQPAELEERELIAGASALGVKLDRTAAASLLRFLDLLYAWNRSAGLTSVPRRDAVRLHLLDSLSIVRFLPGPLRVADLGSGAGLPGIPLAIALPGARVCLVEARRRKGSFLREAVRDLGLANVEVLERDARRLAASGFSFDAVVARAFLPPVELLTLALDLIGPGGLVVVMGARRKAELDAAGRNVAHVERRVDETLTLPGGAEHRRIVVFERREPSSQAP